MRVISVEGEGFTMENSNVSFRKFKVYASMGPFLSLTKKKRWREGGEGECGLVVIFYIDDCI